MTQTQPPPSPSPSQTPAQDDPLARLHKMSTTAGLGSGDYVAVNGAAVATVLLGLASALVLLEEFLLIIPLACIIVAIIAWRQIHNSNGTQAGKALIAIGVVCALGFGGFVVAREATEGIRTREDRAAIAALITEIGEKTRAGEYQALYERTSERFRQNVTREEFDQRLVSIRESDIYGKLTNTTWNGLAEFYTDPGTGDRFAGVKTDFNLEKADRPFPVNLSLHKRDDGSWEIEGMPELFPPQRPAR